MKAIMGLLWVACALTSCRDETCLEILCGSVATVTFSSPVPEEYELSVEVRGNGLSTKCPGSTTHSLVLLSCDANGFTLQGAQAFTDNGAPSVFEVLVSSLKTVDRQFADGVVLKANVTGFGNRACNQSCYRASTTLDIQP